MDTSAPNVMALVVVLLMRLEEMIAACGEGAAATLKKYATCRLSAAHEQHGKEYTLNPHWYVIDAHWQRACGRCATVKRMYSRSALVNVWTVHALDPQ